MDTPEKVDARPVNGRKDTGMDGGGDPYARTANGQFGVGNLGKPKGVRNGCTVPMEVIRETIVGSWESLGTIENGKSGLQRLVALADKSFEAYLHAIAKFMPRGGNVEITIPLMVTPDPALHSAAATEFIDELNDLSDGGKPEVSHVLMLLKKHSSGPSNGKAK